MSINNSNCGGIGAVLVAFTPIFLEDMNEVSLMNRIDTKFICNRRELAAILARAADDYAVLEIDGVRIMDYRNQYFDTENKQFYLDHHNGKKDRSKVRIREYVDSGLVFLEVKRKNNKGRTRKTRSRIPAFQKILSKDDLNFVNKLLPKQEELFPTLQNSFRRITLVSQNSRERVTFDWQLNFNNHEKSTRLEELVVAEVKQASYDPSTPMFKLLRMHRIMPYRISKYCIGISSLYNDVKSNLFKEKLLRINKITTA